MAKRYDPIMCMMVDDSVKTKDANKNEGYKIHKAEIRGDKLYLTYTDLLYGGKETASFTKSEAKGFLTDPWNTWEGNTKSVMMKFVKDSKTIDKAIKTCDAKVHDSVDIEHIADYLWTWASGRDIANELFYEGLDKYSGPHDPEHKKEAYEFARKYATSELNKVYSKLKSVVEKRLKEGFETNKRLIDSYK